MNCRVAALLFYITVAVLLSVPATAYWQSRQQVAISGGFTPSCAESTTYFARSDVIAASITAPLDGYLDTFICGWVAAGLWTSTEVMYPLAGGNATAALINIKSTSFTATLTNAPTYGTGNCGANLGFGLNGTNQNINTNYSPNGSSIFTQNLNGTIVAVTNSRATAQTYSATRYSTGVGGTGFWYIYPYTTSNNVGWNAGASGVFPTQAATNAKGVWHARRTSTTSQALYLNGSVFDTDTGTSGGITTANFYIGAGQGGTADYSTDCISFFYAGSALSGLENAASTLITSFINSVAPGTLP